MVEYMDSAPLEYAIIGAMIIHKDDVNNISMSISPDDFYLETNKEIFMSLRDNPSYDPAILITSIPEQHRQLAVQCVELCVTTAFFDKQVEQLKEMATDRRVKSMLQEMILNPLPIQPSELLELAELSKGMSFEKKNIYSEFAATMNKKEPRISTGFSGIDRMIGGLRIPSVSVVGAYPSTGKTTFALNVALKNDKVLIFSLEMTVNQIIERLISNKANVTYKLFKDKDWKNNMEHYSSAADCLDWLESGSIDIEDEVYDVESQSSIIARKSPQLVIVDYIQKVTTRERKDSRRTEMDYISGMYKKIAKHCNCHIMILSQLSRAGKDDPTMSSLKESGGLEADGDYVFLLHRPYVLKKDREDISPREAWLLCDKNKFGHTGRIDMDFDGAYQRFTEIDTVHAPPKKSTAKESDFRELRKDEYDPLPF